MRDGSLGRKVFERLIQALEELGYFTSHQIVRSQDYGVPQRRARLVLLASLFGPVVFPAPSHGHGSHHSDYATVGEWIGDLPAISAGETHPVVPNHRAARLSPINLRRIQATPPGGGWRDLPPDLMPRKPQVRIQRLHRCLRSFVVGCAGTRSYDKVHQLLQRALRTPAPESCSHCARSRVPTDFPAGLRIHRQPQLSGPAGGERRPPAACAALRREHRKQSCWSRPEHPIYIGRG